MTYSHLPAACLYTGISSNPTLGIEYEKPLHLLFTVSHKASGHFSLTPNTGKHSVIACVLHDCSAVINFTFVVTNDTAVISVLFAIDTDLRHIDVPVAGVQLHGERLTAAVLLHSAVFHLCSDLHSTYFLLQLTDCAQTQHQISGDPLTLTL